MIILAFKICSRQTIQRRQAPLPSIALRHIWDRTQDLLGARSLLFLSFKKCHASDIRSATLASWLKQIILICYKQVHQQPLDLVQVKADDIRAFEATEAFYDGVLVDKIHASLSLEGTLYLQKLLSKSLNMVR